MNTLPPRARDAKALVWQRKTNFPPPPQPNQSPPPTSRLSDLAEAATRAITVSSAVLVIHLALLKFVFLPA